MAALNTLRHGTKPPLAFFSSYLECRFSASEAKDLNLSEVELEA
jgi:hypothetical protein